MTGPEHYKMAESLAARAGSSGTELAVVAALTQLAQVHATLSVAAATALNNIPGGPGTEPYGPMTRAWAEVTK